MTLCTAKCDVIVDEEFRSLIPPLTDEARTGLEKGLLRDGCLDPLIVWAEQQVLLDGHNRKEICDRHGIDYETRELSLPGRDDAKRWIIEHQFGRRNLTKYQRAELALTLVELASAEALEKKSRQMRALNEAKTDQWLRSQDPAAGAILDQVAGHQKRVHAKPNRIYVAVDPKEEKAKIGCACDPELRIKEDIAKHIPDIELVCQFYGDRTIEAMIHEHLKEFRIHNEWFRWNSEVSDRLHQFLDLSGIGQIESGDKIDALRSASELAGISRDSIHKARVISLKADEKTKDRLRRGDTTINKEYQKLKKAERRKQRKARKAARPPVADCPYRVFTADVATATRHVDAESVDWIITDPPYPKKHLDVYTHLAGFAAHALKPGGSLVAMVGQSYLPDILAKLTETLTYHWTLAYLTPGGQAAQLWARKVNTFWKPLLWLTKGKYDGGWIGDVCRSDVNHNDKRFHHWGQSESGMADIIDRLTDPGQVIVDPFLGAGTTGVVAIGMGRRFIGFDVDPDCTAMAEERLADAIEVSS